MYCSVSVGCECDWNVFNFECKWRWRNGIKTNEEENKWTDKMMNDMKLLDGEERDGARKMMSSAMIR